jgi:hypothetical protein
VLDMMEPRISQHRDNKSNWYSVGAYVSLVSHRDFFLLIAYSIHMPVLSDCTDYEPAHTEHSSPEGALATCGPTEAERQNLNPSHQTLPWPHIIAINPPQLEPGQTARAKATSHTEDRAMWVCPQARVTWNPLNSGHPFPSQTQ